MAHERPLPALSIPMTEDATPLPEGNSSDPQRHVGIQNPLVRLPPELRNEIYELVLDLDGEHTPVIEGFGYQGRDGNWASAQTDANFRLLGVDMLIYLEAYSLMASKTQICVPIHRSINYHPDPHTSKETTVSRALKEFMNIHFHLQFDHDVLPDSREAYWYDASSMNGKFEELFDALKVYMSSSQAVSKKHQWIRRRATVHLDHIFNRSPSGGHGARYSIGALQDLVQLISWDINTEWEIRYYIFTGDEGDGSPVDDTHFEGDLALVEAYCRDYDHVSVKAEVYGTEKWEMEGELTNVVRVDKPREIVRTIWDESESE